jgi:hypothetical protein
MDADPGMRLRQGCPFRVVTVSRNGLPLLVVIVTFSVFFSIKQPRQSMMLPVLQQTQGMSRP